MLENCVVLTGLNEEKWEVKIPRRNLIDKELASILPGEDDEEKLTKAKAIQIVNTERIGHYNPMKGRPIAIKFAFKSDADWILSCKKNLKMGIFINKRYSEETEYEQRCLRPILSAARKLDEYRGKCKLEGTDIIIKGKKYNWNNLHELPQNLNTHTVSSRQDASHYGFFGELNPLSNFYLAPFIHEGIHYSTSEQYIQARKADFCGDMEVKQQIMQAKTALKCKLLGKEIKNCDSATWNTAAAKECYPGILSKFQQNVGIASYLKTTGAKTLLECSYNDVWGNGIPLSNPKCINPAEYKHQGILGSMLEQVRDQLLNSADTVPTVTTCPSPNGSSESSEPPVPSASALHVETNSHV